MLNAGGTEPRTISLLMEKDEIYKTLELHAGNTRYPRLERNTVTPDLLSIIATGRSQWKTIIQRGE